MTHIAIPNRDGSTVQWIDKVSDEHYTVRL
jgi:hypothetical protein